MLIVNSGSRPLVGTVTAMPAPDPETPRRGRPPSGGREAVIAAALQLLRERGASRLTTREVAARAGVSEGSVFYHFRDRAGLLEAVIEDGLEPLRQVHAGTPQGEVSEVLDGFSAAVEGFLDLALVALLAAQSDSELRISLADYLERNDLGPHRGVDELGAYLSGAQDEGQVRSDVDARAIAELLVGACFMRASQHQMISESYGSTLPTRQELVAVLVTMLRPAR